MSREAETIATLEGEFDFVFIDADKQNYVNYYEAALPRLSERGLIAVDNTLWSGRVLEPDGLVGTKAIVAFNEHVRADPRVVAVQLTVRDGVTLIRRAASPTEPQPLRQRPPRDVRAPTWTCTGWAAGARLERARRRRPSFRGFRLPTGAGRTPGR